jgi:phospholipid/cholesterol/gamma-HCH transport system substrate-binding protein
VIRRATKIQLVVFVLLSILGILYIGTRYVGFTLGSGPYTVRLLLTNTGGIFTNAEVTERGVGVGKVGAIRLTPDKRMVEVDLQINSGKRIPAQDVRATVANLSAVGEQYVDLEPQSDSGPFLHDGSTIGPDAVTLPPDDATILLDLDRLLNSVNRTHLSTTIGELANAFNNLGPSLSALIDNGSALTQSAIDNLPAELQLINDGRTVLDTQNAVADELKSWAASFAAFSDQLRVSDPALRGILDSGVGASRQLQTLLASNESVLPTLLTNLITFNQIQDVRLPYVRATLELFPPQVAGGFYVTPGDGTAHFGMVNDNNSSPCTTGYSGGDGYQATVLRGNNTNGSTPSDWGGPANLDAFCRAAKDGSTDNRGARMVPRPAGDTAEVTNADPYPGPRYGHTNRPTVQQQGGRNDGVAGALAGPQTLVALPYDPLTGMLTGMDGRSYQLGNDGSLAPAFGPHGWVWLLAAPMLK